MISIIIPVYNTGCFLERCFESIISQSYSDFEVIIVNDGSTDNSLDICKKYSLKDNRFKVYSKSNGGASSARNYGIKNAIGDWICFIDSDDYVKNNYLKKLNEYAIPKSCVMLSDQVESSDIQRKDIPNFIIKHFIQLNTVNKLYDSNVIKSHNIEFPPDVLNGEDFIFASTYFRYLDVLKIIHADEYVYNRNEYSISNKKNNYEIEEHDYLAMRYSWEQLLKENDIDLSLRLKFIWESPVRTRFEHLLYSIIESDFNYKRKLKYMNRMELDIKNYARFYNGKVKRKIIANTLLKYGYFRLYLLFNSCLLKLGKHIA